MTKQVRHIAMEVQKLRIRQIGQNKDQNVHEESSNRINLGTRNLRTIYEGAIIQIVKEINKYSTGRW